MMQTVGGMGAADGGLMVVVLIGAESTSIAGVGVAGVVEFARGMGAVAVMGTVGCMGVANDGLEVVVLAMEGPACSGSGTESSIRVSCVVAKSIVCSVVAMFAESIALPVIGLSAVKPSALDLQILLAVKKN